jgi:hypothetical protein
VRGRDCHDARRSKQRLLSGDQGRAELLSKGNAEAVDIGKRQTLSMVVSLAIFSGEDGKIGVERNNVQASGHCAPSRGGDYALPIRHTVATQDVDYFCEHRGRDVPTEFSPI